MPFSDPARMRTTLSTKGKIVNLIGRIAGSRALQPILEKIELLAQSGMNIGGATLGYDENGEEWVMKFIRRQYSLNDDLSIIDAGAHKGDYARLLRRHFGSSAKIYCFEPSEDLFEQLRAASMNGKEFQVFKLGLGNQNVRTEPFSSDDEIPTLYSEALNVTGQTLRSTEYIDCVRLDDFCIEHGINKICFLKIDVEGNELNVLEGAGEFLKWIDFVQFEFGQHCVASRTYLRDFFTILHPMFRVYRVLRSGLYEIERYNSRLERFSSATNYLAVSRRLRLD